MEPTLFVAPLGAGGSCAVHERGAAWRGRVQARGAVARRKRVCVMAVEGGTTDPADEQAKSGAGREGAPHEIPQSEVDWNSEWSKFKETGMKTDAGAGRKGDSREVRAAKRTIGKVQNSLQAASAKVPTRRQLFADWKFWVGIILALSLFTAAVNSSQVGVGGVGTV